MVIRNSLRVMLASRAMVRSVLDRFVIAPYLRVLGVEFGYGCRFSGMPIVKRHPDSRIILAPGVLVISRSDENPATLPHRTMLSTLGKGAIIRVGADAGISGASIAASTSVEIGERSQVGSGAMLWDTDFHPLDPELRRAHRTACAAQAPIRVGCDVFIGARAIVLKGVSIGDGAVVGAGAVVASDVPPGALVAGNPARVIRDAVRTGACPPRPRET